MMRSVMTMVMALAALVLGTAERAEAHCDTLDGPVVKTAEKALATGDLAPVLAWVKAENEAEIKAAFAQARAVQKQGGEAKALAARWFYETVVRVHRAGEGAPYTGLKPAGATHDALIEAADAVAAGGPADEVVAHLTNAVEHGLHLRHERLRSLTPPGKDPQQGRQWVAAYVDWLHYVVGVGAAAGGSAEPHVD
jgi:hypothetical protein